MEYKTEGFGDIHYQSGVDSPNFKTSLTYPDGIIQDINLPYSFIVSQVGTYELSITASKEGYRTISMTEQFGVIEKQIGTLGAMGISDASMCNADEICNNNENNQNCPQDCPPTIGLAETFESRNRIIFYILMLLLIEVILIIGIYLTYKSLKKGD